MSFSVINALIANKNNQIVVDYSAYHGNFQQIELMILKKINNSTIGEIKYNNQYKFYFEKENEITYMCLVKENESLPHTESLYTLLYDLKHKFLDKYKNENIQNSSAFKYQTFSHEIKPIVDFYNENDDYVKERVVQKLKRRIILNTTIDEYIDSSSPMIDLQAEKDSTNLNGFNGNVIPFNIEDLSGDKEILNKLNKANTLKLYVKYILFILIILTILLLLLFLSK